MVNEEVARIFERMARILAFKGADRFRIMAYERAAVSIRDLEEDLASIAEQGKLEDESKHCAPLVLTKAAGIALGRLMVEPSRGSTSTDTRAHATRRSPLRAGERA